MDLLFPGAASEKKKQDSKRERGARNVKSAEELREEKEEEDEKLRQGPRHINLKPANVLLGADVKPKRFLLGADLRPQSVLLGGDLLFPKERKPTKVSSKKKDGNDENRSSKDKKPEEGAKRPRHPTGTRRITSRDAGVDASTIPAVTALGMSLLFPSATEDTQTESGSKDGHVGEIDLKEPRHPTDTRRNTSRDVGADTSTNRPRLAIVMGRNLLFPSAAEGTQKESASADGHTRKSESTEDEPEEEYAYVRAIPPSDMELIFPHGPKIDPGLYDDSPDDDMLCIAIFPDYEDQDYRLLKYDADGVPRIDDNARMPLDLISGGKDLTVDAERELGRMCVEERAWTTPLPASPGVWRGEMVTIHCVVLGSPGVGKTSLIKAAMGELHSPEVTLSSGKPPSTDLHVIPYCAHKQDVRESRYINLRVLDVSGDSIDDNLEHYLTHISIVNVSIVVFVHSVHERDSAEAIIRWVRRLEDNSDTSHLAGVLLVGNKVDLKHVTRHGRNKSMRKAIKKCLNKKCETFQASCLRAKMRDEFRRWFLGNAFSLHCCFRRGEQLPEVWKHREPPCDSCGRRPF